jgi:hypothetical protein
MNLNGGASVDKTKPQQFLDTNVVQRIVDAVDHMLADDTYRKNLNDLRLESTPALAELDRQPVGTRKCRGRVSAAEMG